MTSRKHGIDPRGLGGDASLLSRGRGLEHEYIVNTDPPLGLEENIARRLLIAKAIDQLGQAGLLWPHVAWSVKHEEGNLEYEHSLRRLWPLATEAPSVAKNGMRVYDDALHLEIATPVYSVPEEALAYAKASEIMAFVASRLAGSSERRDVHVYTSNISMTKDVRGHYAAVACGTHGNTAIPRRLFNSRHRKDTERALIPYLVTRSVVFGSGGYVPFVPDKKGSRLTRFTPLGSAESCGSTLVGADVSFVVSPRSHFVNCLDSVDTTVKRGLFNLRDEPHADEHTYWRLHDINWEGIRCDLQVYVRDVLNAFILAALEKGYLIDPPRLSHPLRDMKSVSMDEAMDWRVAQNDGSVVDAADDILIGYYLKKIEEMLDKEKAPTGDWTAFTVVSKILDRISERDLASLVYCLDWVTKLTLIEACDSQDEMLAACNQFCLCDQSVLEYLGHKPLPNGDSLFQPHRAIAKLAEWVPEFTQGRLSRIINRALLAPPTSTREARRMRLIAEDRVAGVEASWQVLSRSDSSEVWLPQPLEHTDDSASVSPRNGDESKKSVHAG